MDRAPPRADGSTAWFVPSLLAHGGSLGGELWQPAYRGRAAMLMVFHLLQTIGIYGFANWAPTFLLAQGKTLGQSLEYGFLIALVSPVGPWLGVITTERVQRKRMIVVLALLMAGSGLMFRFARDAFAIVGIGALLTIFSYWFSAGIGSRASRRRASPRKLP